MSFFFSAIIEDHEVVKYLQKRGLVLQYKKAKQQILQGNFGGNVLKYRQPLAEKVLYFRINKQFRALCRERNGILIVFEVNNHQ